MFVSPSPVTSSSKVLYGQWHEEQDDRQQGSMTIISGDHPEPSHLRSRSSIYTQSPKRRSVFSGRSRSNTATSTISSHPSLASSMTSIDASSLQSYHDDRYYPAVGSGFSDRQERGSKSLLSRGSRILRRQGSKFNLSTNVNEDGGGKAQKFDVIEFFQRGHKSSQSDPNEQLKSLISEPFGFHHLTHTSASQFRSLNNTSKDDLVTEFSAIRAGQKPVAELKGIQAEDLHFRNFSSEDLTERDDPVVIDDEVVSRGATSPSPPRTARNARTVENFSRPVSRMQKAATSPSITPPPRISSRQVVSDIPEPTSQMMDEILGLNAPPTLPDFVYSTPEDVIGRTFSIDQIGLAGAFLDDDDSHAVTTADDSSNITSASVINSYLSDLEDVPEEDETPVWHGNVEQTSLPHSLDHDGPSPAVSISNSPARQSYHKYILAKETSLSLSGPLGSPTLPRFHLSVGEPLGLQAEEQLKRLSVSEDFPPSWDEDIDYCYEHAAESDCNFDWRRNSSKLARGSVTEQTLGNSEKLMEGNAKLPLRSLLHALEINNSVPGTPDLDPGSAFSALTTGTHEAVTPLTAGGASVDFLSNEQQVTQGDYFKPIGPQLLQPAFGKDVVHDAIYEELIVAGEDPDDCPFSLYAPHESQSMGFPTSPRNSYSPLSKCNSEESIILSRAASIVRKHRSSASSASVPELIPSRESTIRESLGSIEHGSFEALTPVSPISRPTSLLRHRRTKSPAAEVMMNLRSPRSSDSIETTEIPYPLILPAHDRAKSASAVHVDTLMTAIQPCGPPFAVRMQSPPSLKERGKRSRASYSLFPLAATAVTATTTPTPTSPRS